MSSEDQRPSGNEAASNAIPRRHKPVRICLSERDLERAAELAREQTQRFGHDRGRFTIGRRESSHLYGFVGELATLTHLRELAAAPDEVGLCEMGSSFDIWFMLVGARQYAHVKTGFWQNWPTPESAFGVHANQGIETSNAPVILVSALRADLQTLRIEGALGPHELVRCAVIRKGETFPGSSYLSRTDNRVTYLRDYLEIRALSDLQVKAPRTAEWSYQLLPGDATDEEVDQFVEDLMAESDDGASAMEDGPTPDAKS